MSEGNPQYVPLGEYDAPLPEEPEGFFYPVGDPAPTFEPLAWVGPQEREALLARADIFALPSRNEGLPMSVLEAMARGLPVIATPVGGLPELIEDGVNGILVPPGDANALARAILKLSNDPAACAALGRAARQTVLARHSPAVVLPALEEVYAVVTHTDDRSTANEGE